MNSNLRNPTCNPPSEDSNTDRGARLFLRHQSPNISKVLGDFISSLQQDDPLAPVTVVGPSTYANLTLRHEWARHGFVNIQFLTLPRLSELLGAPSLSEKGRKPLTSALENVIIRRVASGSPGILGPVSSHPTTHQSLRLTFSQLRDAPAQVLSRLGNLGTLQKEVVDLYEQFRQDTLAFYSREELAQAAADAITKSTCDEAVFGEDIGFVVFYLPRDVTPAEKNLIEALAQARRCAVFLGLTGDEVSDAPIQGLAGSLKTTLGEPSATPESENASETHLVIVPDPHEEVRWAIRSIMAHAESGTPFGRIAVLYRQRVPYATLIHEEMELAGVPAAGPNAVRLADTAVGRTLTDLLNLPEVDFKRSEVASWLTSCPVRPPCLSQSEFSPSRWDAISKEAGVVRGVEQWRERLSAYADRLEQRAAESEVREEISESRATAMRRGALEARNLLAFIERLVSDAAPPEDGSSWSEFCDWAQGLLDSYIARAADLPQSETEALKKIEAALSSLKAIDSVASSSAFSDFRDSIMEALQSTLGHLGPTGQGVFIAPVGAAIGMSFDAVYILGMIEGAFPPALADDPLISDSDRQSAGGSTAGLATRQDRIVKERYEFLSALATSSNRTFSYPKVNPASQRANYASRWFLEQASALEGCPIGSSKLEPLDSKPWLTVIPSMEQALASVSNLSAADFHDHDLELLWNWKRAGWPLRRHPLALSGSLVRSLRMGRERYSPRFTEWDGNLSGVAEGLSFAKQIEDALHSPTSLERWAKCPFSYFLGNVLRIVSTESPEDVQAISALERGLLVHRILEDFIREAQGESRIPAPSEPWDSAHRSSLRRIADRAFRKAEERGVTGKRLLWNLEKQNILADLDAFLDSDAEIRSRFGVSPAEVETRFGMGGESWEQAVWTMANGRRMGFKGLIDRVDVSPDGSSALILDYKTGSESPYKKLEDDPIDRGQRLQLAVYSLAARAKLGADTVVRAAYWFVTSRGDFALVPKQPIAIDDDTAKRFEEGVSTIVSGIQGGLFPANPGGPGWQSEFEHCNFCDFDSLCPSRRGRMWEHVRSSSLLADYKALSSE